MEEKIITYEDIQKANETIKATDIKGKNYAEVNQRIKVFRMIYPTGTIETEMVSNQNGICIFRACIYDGDKLLATGTAYEKENSTFINKTSYIENCETSAVGRALGMCGFGIDTSVASAEEVQNTMNNQKEMTVEEARALVLDFGKHQGKTIGELVDEKSSYINYLFQSGKPEIKQAITLLTGMKDVPLEEQKEKLGEMPITEAQKQQIKDTYSAEDIRNYLIDIDKSKLSKLTYEEADTLLKQYDEKTIEENREKEEIF